MTTARSELLERYRALPLPTTKDEHWRFTDLSGFDPDAWTADGAAGIAAPPSLLDLDVAGVAYVGEGGIEIERVPDGIRFEPLPEDHELLYSLVGWDEKFAAHNAASWKNGLLVHVPRGVVVERPLYVRVAWVTGGFGSAKGKVRIQNDLAGPGATSRVTGAYFVDGKQHLDYDTFQEHIAPSTTSDFAFKGALRDEARAVWRGMIRVEQDAQKTNAYQENRNLLLSKTAHADSIPGLEILANDVRCTHGATLGQVDRDQLFYLMTRGLNRSEAERLIVRGFFQDALDRVKLEPVREALAAALEARIPKG